MLVTRAGQGDDDNHHHPHHHHHNNHQTPTCAGHGDDGPVEGLGQGVEGGAGLILLQGVGQAREYQHPHADSHGQQQQLSGEMNY